MGFAKDAIGFYLQLDDTLTPALGKATKGYDNFVKMLDKANTKAFNSAKKGLGALAGLVEQFKSLPGTAATAYGKAITAITKKQRPLKVPVEFTFTKAAEKKLDSVMTKAVAAAFSRASFRFGPAMPSKRSNFFDNTKGLRTQYKKTVQPPDMIGKLKIPHFAKGGHVGKPAPGAPKGPASDPVLAFLTPGESVNTVDETKALRALGGAAKDASGKFTALPKELVELMVDSKNIMAAMPKLKDAIDLGLDPHAAQLYDTLLHKLMANQKALAASTAGLGMVTKVKLAPALAQVNAQIAALTPATAKAEGTIVKFLKSIVGDTRFLALSHALETIQEDFLEIHHAAGELSEFSGLEKAGEGLVENFLQMNSVLHLSGEKLNDFRMEALGAWKEIPLAVRSVSDLSESLQALVNAGVDKKLAIDLSGAVSVFARATGIAREEAVQLAVVLSKQLAFSAEQSADIMSDLAVIGGQAGVSMQILAPIMQDVAHEGQQFFAALDPRAAKTALESITRIAAAVAHATDADTAKEFSEIIAGSLNDADKMATLSGVLGKSTQDLTAELTSGDLTGFFKEMQTAGPQAATEIAKAFGASGKAIFAMSNRTDQMNTALTMTSANSTKAGTGLEKLSDMATENMTTFEKLKQSLGNFFSGFTWVQNLLQFFEDLNPMVLLSSAYLVTKMVPAFRLFGTAAVEGAEGAKAAEASGSLLATTWKYLGKGLMWLVGLIPALIGGIEATIAASATLGGTVTFFGAALAIATAPLTLIIAGVAALIGLVYYFRKEIMAATMALVDGFIGGFSELFDGIKPLTDAFGELWTQIKVAFSPIIDWFSSSGDGSKNLEGIKDVFTVIGQVLGGVIAVVLNTIIQAISFVVKIAGDVLGLFNAIGEAISSWSFQPIIGWVKKLGQHIIDFVLYPINKALGAFGFDPIKVDLGGGAAQATTPGGALTAPATTTKGAVATPTTPQAVVAQQLAPDTPQPALPTRSEIDTMSSRPRLGNDASVDVLNDMLTIMKETLSAIRGNGAPTVNVAAGGTPRARGGLGYDVVMGGH